MRICLAYVTLLLLASLSESAPVPFPRGWTTEAEAVLVCVDAAGGKGMSERLTSSAFLAEVLRSKQAAALNSLQGVKQPAAWLRDRLKVEMLDGGARLRVRVVHCRASDALLLLAVITDLVRPPQGPKRAAAMASLCESTRVQHLMVRLAARNRGGCTKDELERAAAAVRRYQAELDGAVVQQKPRVVNSHR